MGGEGRGVHLPPAPLLRPLLVPVGEVQLPMEGIHPFLHLRTGQATPQVGNTDGRERGGGGWCGCMEGGLGVGG